MSTISHIPLWVIYSLTTALAFASAELGYRFGLWLTRRDRGPRERSMTGTVVGAELGLLAFILAFSIGIAANNFAARRDLVVMEANAIETAYLRAGFLDAPQREETRGLLSEYLDARLTALSPGQFDAAVQHSIEINSRLWAIAEQEILQNPDSNPANLFVDAINRLIDVHSERLTAETGLHLPDLMWLVFYGTIILAFFSVGFGSSRDGNRDLAAWLLFALALSAVMMLLMEYDRPHEGLFNISQQPLLDLKQLMLAYVK